MRRFVFQTHMMTTLLLMILATIIIIDKESGLMSVVHALPQFEGWAEGWGEQGYVEAGPENNWGGFGTEEQLDHHVAYGYVCTFRVIT